MFYKGKINVRLNSVQALSKDEASNWTFTIDNSVPFDRLYLWVRGTYGDRNYDHPYSIDQVYYVHLPSNTFGSMGAWFGDDIRNNVRQYEKE
jgi:hypothetical protein